MGAPESNYTCIGAPVGHSGFGPGSSRGSEGGSGRGGSLSNQDQEGLNWGRSYAAGGAGSQQRLDHPSPINRYHDGF